MRRVGLIRPHAGSRPHPRCARHRASASCGRDRCGSRYRDCSAPRPAKCPAHPNLSRSARRSTHRGRWAAGVLPLSKPAPKLRQRRWVLPRHERSVRHVQLLIGNVGDLGMTQAGCDAGEIRCARGRVRKVEQVPRGAAVARHEDSAARGAAGRFRLHQSSKRSARHPRRIRPKHQETGPRPPAPEPAPTGRPCDIDGIVPHDIQGAVLLR